MATQAQLDALDAAIASGLTEVRMGEKILKYQTTGELLAARTALARQLALAAVPTTASPRFQVADFRD